MTSTSTRVFLGGVAGALAMLLFHQTTLQVLFWCGLAPQAAFRIAHVLPFNVPMIVSLVFWGAMYGSLFGWLVPRMPSNIMIRGLAAGVFALLMSWFVVRPLAGHLFAFGWDHAALLRSTAANLMWGFGIALIQPLMSPRCLISRSRAWAAHHLAT